MIDFHSHILPGIDDGSRNLEQSIYMVNEAKNVGFTKIISTSHYMENYYECNERERKRLLKEVQDSVDGIEFRYGDEIVAVIAKDPDVSKKGVQLNFISFV